MTEIEIKLPDDVARRASKYGLLTDDAFQQMLEDAIWQEDAKRQKPGYALLEFAKGIREVNPPMSDEEIVAAEQIVVAEVKADRAERRAERRSAKLP